MIPRTNFFAEHDPSFEKDPSHWTLTGLASIETEQPRGGLRSLKLQATGSPAAYGEALLPRFSQSVGIQLVGSYYVMVPAASVLGDVELLASLQVGSRWYDFAAVNHQSVTPGKWFRRAAIFDPIPGFQLGARFKTQNAAAVAETWTYYVDDLFAGDPTVIDGQSKRLRVKYAIVNAVNGISAGLDYARTVFGVSATPVRLEDVDVFPFSEVILVNDDKDSDQPLGMKQSDLRFMIRVHARGDDAETIVDDLLKDHDHALETLKPAADQTDGQPDADAAANAFVDLPFIDDLRITRERPLPKPQSIARKDLRSAAMMVTITFRHTIADP